MSKSFQILDEYENYMLAVLSRSDNTVLNYKTDISLFFRYLKTDRKLTDKTDISEVDIDDIDLKFLSSVDSNDIYAFLIWLNRTCKLTASSRARKISSLRSFYKYCCNKKHYFEYNPTSEIENPKIGKRLPKYLSLDESQKLVEAAYNTPTESNERDYCMLVLFLNCGMRLSELINIDITDIRGNILSVIGKGNKERTIYLNSICLDAIEAWMEARGKYNIKPEYKNALFVSKRGKRISPDMVEIVIKRLLMEAGIDSDKYSVHKLRHTAATLMYKYGEVDLRSLQTILGHANVSTTQIYTHVDEDMLHQATEKNPLANYKPREQ